MTNAAEKNIRSIGWTGPGCWHRDSAPAMAARDPLDALTHCEGRAGLMRARWKKFPEHAGPDSHAR